MHKPKSKGRLERWVDRVSKSFDKWFDDREKKYANYAQEEDEEPCIWEMNELFGFSNNPKNLKRFI